MIRRARPEDVAAIAELFRRSFGTLTFLPTLHTPEEDREFFARAVVEHEVWIWEKDDRMLGFASLGEDMLNHLYVEPDAHGRGIGSELFRWTTEHRPNGFRFWVFQRNDGARRFYERRGCRLIELTDGARNEERPDALYEWRPAMPTEGPGPARRASGANGRSRSVAPRSSLRRSR